MASKATAPSYVVNQPFDRDDNGKHTHYEPPQSWPADHPDTETYLEWQLIVPAPAGSSQPGNNDGSAAK
jgi:hypothetical protein